MAGVSTFNGRSNTRSISSLLLIDGTWTDANSLFPLALVTMDPEAYFASKEEYYERNNIKPPSFDRKKLDAIWGKLVHLKHGSSFQYHKWKDVLSKAFQIGGDYSWRVPSSDERLYSRPEDSGIAIPIEHFKAGLRPKPHRFLVALFKQQFRCTPAQFTPNSIRLILWFIASCNRNKRQPTFEAFFIIFSVKKSNCVPFYEVVQGNRNSRIGLLADGVKPVKLPNTLKNWQYEFIMMHGGDWSYMPGFSANCEPRCFIQRNGLSEMMLKNCVICLCVFKTPWGKDELYTVKMLKFYGLYPPSSMDRAEFVWGKDKVKIGEFLRAQPPKPSHLRKWVEVEVERGNDQFCRYGYGAALAACRERARRKLAETKVKALCEEKVGLISDIGLLREEAEEDFAVEKKRLESQVKEAVDDANRAKEKLEVAGAKLDAAERENNALSTRVRLLEEQLDAMPSREDVILEYKATPMHVHDLDDAVAAFRGSVDFTRAVGVERRKMTPLVVDCCREFLRDDLHRSREGFETYFLAWVRARQRASSRGLMGVPP